MYKNSISFQISKNHFSPFSAVYHFLIDFSKILQFTLQCSQPILPNLFRTWEHRIECISQNSWSNFHETLILHPKLHKEVKKNTMNLSGKNIRPSSFQDFFLSMNNINGKNLKEFNIFDLTPIGWPWNDNIMYYKYYVYIYIYIYIDVYYIHVYYIDVYVCI